MVVICVAWWSSGRRLGFVAEARDAGIESCVESIDRVECISSLNSIEFKTTFTT